MALSEELVLEELKKVIDPELFVNIVDLGLIYDVKIEDVEPSEGDQAVAETPVAETPVAETPVAETPAAQTPEAKAPDAAVSSGGGPAVEQKNIKIDMTMTSPMCPAGPQLIGQSKQFVGAMEGVNEVEVKVVLDPPWTPDLMTEDARDQLGIF